MGIWYFLYMQSSPLPNVFPVWWECRIGHRTSQGFFIVIESIMSVDKITKTYNSIYKWISKSNNFYDIHQCICYVYHHQNSYFGVFLVITCPKTLFDWSAHLDLPVLPKYDDVIVCSFVKYTLSLFSNMYLNNIYERNIKCISQGEKGALEN